MIASGKQIKEMVVMKYADGFYFVRYRDTGGGLRVREGRLYPSIQLAQQAGGILPKDRMKKQEERFDFDLATDKYYTQFWSLQDCVFMWNPIAFDMSGRIEREWLLWVIISPVYTWYKQT